MFAGLTATVMAEGPVEAALQQMDVCEIEAAQLQLEQYLKKSPADVAVMLALGRVRLAAGDTEHAVEWLERSVTAGPASAEAHFRLGEALAAHVNNVSVFRKPGVGRRMREVFARAVELAPESVDYRGALLQWYVQAPGIVGGSVEKAREQLEQLRPRDAAWGHYYEAMVLEQEGRKAESELALDRAAAAGVTEALDLRAQRLAQTQDWPAVFAALEALLAHDPKQLAAWYGLGRTSAVSGQNLARGEQALKNFLSNPRHRCQAGNLTAAAAHWRLGNIYERMGRKDDARVAYRAALDADPKFDDARKSLQALR